MGEMKMITHGMGETKMNENEEIHTIVPDFTHQA